MRAEVVCVGTELLLGDIANTNAQAIGRELARIGIDCHVHTSVGDNEERIAEAIASALARADAVVLTGGLGPTQDDVTREAIARATGQRLVLDEALAETVRRKFARMRRGMPEANLRQAERPENAVPLENAVGTAPGLLVEQGGKVIYAVPGVPAEMEEMLARAVLPDLARRAGGTWAIVSRVVRACGMAESAVAEAVAPIWSRLGGSGVTMAFLTGSGEVRVRLAVKASSESAGAALLDEAERDVRSVLGSAVVGVDGDTLEVVIGRLLSERRWTLACGESMTGGMLSARITDVPGASAYFRGCVVSYASEAKEAALGVDPAALRESGPVSVEVARQMAAGARRLLGADVGLAISGVAGPAPHGGARVGSVVLAVSGPLGEAGREVRLPGGRATVRQMAATAALNLLRLYLQEALD